MSEIYPYTKTSVEKLIPYARNARTHSDAQVAQIAASIREFGFTNPVLIDAEGGIIAGHGRVMAARKLGMKEVPTITLAHLTETQKRAYILADNQLALNSGWDDEMLRLELAELGELGFDLELAGFDDGEMFGSFDEDEDEDAPTADDLRDVAEGAANESEGKSIMFPILVQVKQAEYKRWRDWKAGRPDAEAFTALLDIALEAEE